MDSGWSITIPTACPNALLSAACNAAAGAWNLSALEPCSRKQRRASETGPLGCGTSEANITATLWGEDPCNAQPASCNVVDSVLMNASSAPGSQSISNGVPAKGAMASRMLAACSGLITRGNIFLDSSRFSLCSSSALLRANAARSLASAILISDRLFNSAWRLEAIRPNCTSPATPRKTSISAIDDPHRSQNESYGGWIAAIANSAKMPKARISAQYQPQDSHESIERSNSSLLAFINPYRKRQAGKAFRGFWFGVGTAALMFVILFVVGHFAK